MVQQKKNKSNFVIKEEHGKNPKIIVKDMPISSNYYRVTGIKVDSTKYYIFHQDEHDFVRGFNRLKRSYKFNNQDVEILGTKTHRYASTTFIAKGFKP
jgi:hypothetical protein